MIIKYISMLTFFSCFMSLILIILRVQSSGFFSYSIMNKVVLGIYELNARFFRIIFTTIRIGFINFFFVFVLFLFDYISSYSFQKYKILVTSSSSSSIRHWNCTKKPIETHYLLYLWFVERSSAWWAEPRTVAAYQIFTARPFPWRFARHLSRSRILSIAIQV